VKEIIYNEAKVKSKNLQYNCALQLGQIHLLHQPKKDIISINDSAQNYKIGSYVAKLFLHLKSPYQFTPLHIVV